MTLSSFRLSRWSVLALAAALPGLTHAQQSNAPTVQYQLADEQQFPIDSDGAYSGISRSQGITTDGNLWYFSWQYGLEIANAQFGSDKREEFDIPTHILFDGLNHIGDIDYRDGLLYVALDDTNGYMNGHVALYNASNLAYAGVIYSLIGAPSNPRNDVASWVAVNPNGLYGYGKEWQLGNTINIYKLSDWSFLGVGTMDLALERIQGGKVFGDWLYMSSDNATKTVYRANMTNGHVEILFSLPTPSGSLETEGIAVRSAIQICEAEQAAKQTTRDCSLLSSDAADLYVEMVVTPSNPTDAYVALYHYAAQP